MVSFIRLMRDLDDTSPLGFLVMNIKEKSIAQAYANLPASDSFQVAILDEHQQIIASNATTTNATNTMTNKTKITTTDAATATVFARTTAHAATPTSTDATEAAVSSESDVSSSIAQRQASLQEILEANQTKLKQAFQEQPSGVLTLHSGGQDYEVTYRSAGEDQWKYISMSPYRATDTRNISGSACFHAAGGEWVRLFYQFFYYLSQRHQANS